SGNGSSTAAGAASASAAAAKPAAGASPAGGASGPAARAGSAQAGAAPRDADRRLSPAVRRLAAEHDLALDRIEGSGRNGRITRRDVLQFLESKPAGQAGAAALQPSASLSASAPQASQPAAARPPAGPLEAGV